MPRKSLVLFKRKMICSTMKTQNIKDFLAEITHVIDELVNNLLWWEFTFYEHNFEILSSMKYFQNFF